MNGSDLRNPADGRDGQFEPPGRRPSPWNPRAIGVVAAVITISLFTFVFLSMFSMFSLDTGTGYRSYHVISDLVRIALTIFTFGMIVVVVLAVGRHSRRAPALVQPWTFDMAVFQRYLDCLEALSIGAGVDRPQMYVKNMGSPLAYVEYSVTQQSGLFVGYRTETFTRTIALTNDLLSRDFTYPEIEAIAAVLLAKTVLDVSEQVPPGYFDRWVAELGLNDYLVGMTRAEFLDDRVCLFCLLTDAYAARLTRHPEAIVSAIKKSDDLLRAQPGRPRGVEPRMMFVEPPASGERGLQDLGALFMKVPFRSTGAKRDRIIELRLESLGVIDQGTRQPHSEIRDGRSVTTPPGWE